MQTLRYQGDTTGTISGSIKASIVPPFRTDVFPTPLRKVFVLHLSLVLVPTCKQLAY